MSQAFLPLAEVCTRLSISRATLWRMTRRGDFPKAVQISPGRVGVPADELDNWQRSKREQRAAA
jgi:prophage regulatory protein